MHLLVLSLYLLCLSFNLEASELGKPFIEIITSDEFPISGIQNLTKHGIVVKLYNFDDSKRMIAQLEANLPNNEVAATKAMQLRLKKMGDESLRKLFTQAFQAVIISTQYNITRYPAVIFDHGLSVVYGVTDIPHALALYRQWGGIP